MKNEAVEKEQSALYYMAKKTGDITLANHILDLICQGDNELRPEVRVPHKHSIEQEIKAGLM